MARVIGTRLKISATIEVPNSLTNEEVYDAIDRAYDDLLPIVKRKLPSYLPVGCVILSFGISPRSGGLDGV